MTLSAPERYSLLMFAFLLALATIHISGCSSLAVKVMKRLSTSSPVVIITPLALFIPASSIMLSSVASPGIAKMSGSSHNSFSTTFLFLSIIMTFLFLFLSSLCTALPTRLYPQRTKWSIVAAIFLRCFAPDVISSTAIVTTVIVNVNAYASKPTPPRTSVTVKSF